MREKSVVSMTKDLVLNIKVLPFTPIANVRERFNVIKLEFKDKHPKYLVFLNYFEKNYIGQKTKDARFPPLYWNFNKDLVKTSNNKKAVKSHLFFTNNYVESCNRTLNS